MNIYRWIFGTGTKISVVNVKISIVIIENSYSKYGLDFGKKEWYINNSNHC